VRVVDHDPFRTAAEITQSFGEKNLAVKPLKAPVALKEQHARVASDDRSGLHSALFSSDLDFMGKGVILKLLASGKLILPRGRLRRFGQTVPATERRQRLDVLCGNGEKHCFHTKIQNS
jgi:hypothetical protein